MCISIIISIVLTYYFMLYMMERFNYLAKKKHEDEMYRKEMYYKEQYYSEVDRRHEYVHNLKHDMKNKLIELHYLVEHGDIGVLYGNLLDNAIEAY